MSRDFTEEMLLFGERFREERERLGWKTQASLGSRLLRSGKTIGKYESAQTAPDVRDLMMFASLGADLWYLLTGERSRSQAAEITTPATRLAGEVFGLSLTAEDADLVLGMAKRLDAGRRTGP